MESFKEDILAEPQKARPRVFTFFLYGTQKVMSCLFIEPAGYFESRSTYFSFLTSDTQTTNI
jgi:hypothetical protein